MYTHHTYTYAEYRHLRVDLPHTTYSLGVCYIAEHAQLLRWLSAMASIIREYGLDMPIVICMKPTSSQSYLQ